MVEAFEFTVSRQIEIFVNGANRQVPDGQTVASLLEWLEISSDRVAVELNKAIVRKRDWAQTAIAGGSEIEVVEFVGGG